MERIHAVRADQHSPRHSGSITDSSTESSHGRSILVAGSIATGRAVDLIDLQRTIGNRGVVQLLARSSVLPGAIHRVLSPQFPHLIQRQIVDEDVKDVLTEEEVKFFEAGPPVAVAEDQLQKLMRERKPPIKFELGLIYEGTVLKRVLKGTASSGIGGTTTKPPQVKITTESVAKALGIEPPGPDEEAQKFSNVTVTHNHPGGAPLSRGDVAMAVGRGMREMRAVGKFGVFAVVRLKETWTPITPEEVATHFAKGEARWKSVCPENLATMQPMDQGPDIGANFAADNFMAKHFACISLQEAFPGVIGYTHPGETSLIKARSNLYPISPIKAKEAPESKLMTTGKSFGFSAFGGQQKQVVSLPGKKVASNEM